MNDEGEDYLESESEEEEENEEMTDDQFDWMTQGLLTLPVNLHRLPKHLEKLVTKYDPTKKVKAQDHIDYFYFHLQMSEVCFDDISCRLFPYTLEGRASVWYHSLPPN